MRKTDGEDGWWQRNWGWCLGCGCLLPLVAIGGIALTAYMLGDRLITGNGAIESALELVREDPRAIEALGEPIDARVWGENTSINYSSGGKLKARMSVAGPEGSARLEIEAHGDGEDGWILDRLLLHLDGRADPVDLLLPGDETRLREHRQ